MSEESEVKKNTPEEIASAHKQLQGERATKKKKMNCYTIADCQAELTRIDQT